MSSSTDTLALPDEVADALAGVVEHLNDHHDDSILFLARHATGRRAARAATIGEVRADGVALRLELGEGDQVVDRVDFAAPVETLEQVRAQLLDLLASARAANLDAPLTSIEEELAAVARRPTFATTVSQVHELSPNLREVVLQGGLEAFTSLGGDQFLTVIVPRDHHDGLPDGLVVQDLGDLPVDQRPHAATYTVRRFLPDRGELVLWMVLHEHGGPVSTWARHAAPGDRLAVTGAHRTWQPPADLDRMLLVGDETALPAIAAILDELSDDQRAEVVIETVDVDHAVHLATPPGSRVHWVFRDGDPGTGQALLDAVVAPDATLRDPRFLDAPGLAVFGAGEVAQMRPIRSHLRHERGLEANRVDVSGYWRRTSTAD